MYMFLQTGNSKYAITSQFSQFLAVSMLPLYEMICQIMLCTPLPLFHFESYLFRQVCPQQSLYSNVVSAVLSLDCLLIHEQCIKNYFVAPQSSLLWSLSTIKIKSQIRQDPEQNIAIIKTTLNKDICSCDHCILCQIVSQITLISNIKTRLTDSLNMIESTKHPCF